MRGRSRARAARRSAGGADPAPSPRACSPSPSRPARGLHQPPAALGGRGAETHEVGPGQPSSLALGPAPGRTGSLQPRPPTVGAPSLLELLDLLQAEPRTLVDTEVTQHLLHRLCVRVLHGCGGPAGLASPSPRPPRLRLALAPRARATPGAQARTGVSPSFSGRFRLAGR